MSRDRTAPPSGGAAGRARVPAGDPALVERIRDALAGRPGIGERSMFGGVGFLVEGNLLVSASGRGGMLVRVGPEGHAAALAAPHAAPMEMNGRAMRGYVVVAPAGVASPGAVASWIERAWKHVRTLAPRRAEPPKAKPRPRPRATARTGTRAAAPTGRARTRRR